MTATTDAEASPGMHPIASPTCTLHDPLTLAAPVGVAAEVMAQLALVVDAAAAGGFCGMGSEAALRVVEAVERVKSWADSVSVAATGVMCAELESEFADLGVRNPTSRTWIRWAQSCRSATAREIQVATGLSIFACQNRVRLAALEGERAGPVRAGMRLGRVSFERAVVLTEATAHLDADTAAEIAARVLRPLTGPDGVALAGTAPLSQATFRARLRTQIVMHHGLIGHAERTYEQAVRDRRFQAEPNPDGTGSVFFTGDGARISAAAQRVDRIVRRLRNDGDPRTLAQLRADVATDLLLRGWIPTDERFTASGKPPAAFVHVTVSLSTLLGLDHGVAQLRGWGAVSAAQARDLALQAGSIWTRIVTDPLTGRAVEATATTYRVPAAMATQIHARDHTCRAPVCEIPAEGSDLDHCVEWEPHHGGGPTAETNLAALHRGHHNLKTNGFWDSDQHSDGTLTWTTATGRKVKTYPHVYDHPDNLPIHNSLVQTWLGQQLAPVSNPEIPIPGHINILDHIGWANDLADATPPPTRTPAPPTSPAPASTPANKPDPGPPPF